MKKVAVVGGGITGLTAALALREAGFHPLLYDASAVPGGVIQTISRDGYRVEAGPNTIQENLPEIGRLIEAAGLSGEVVEANPAAKKRFIVRGGKPVPLPASPPDFLRSPFLSLMGKLRLLGEPFRARPRDGAEESIADFARRRMGPEVRDYLIDPFVSGIFAGDPARLSLSHAFPRIHAMETQHGSLLRAMIAAGRARKKGAPRPRTRLISFRDGLGALPQALAALLAKQRYTEATVESITAREGKWELVARRFDHRLRDRYDAVVIALPPHQLARLPVTGLADGSGLGALAGIVHPAVTSVSLGFTREQVGHPLDGFGVLAPRKENRFILGALFPSTLFPDRAPPGHVLLTSFLGGRRKPEMAALDDHQAVETVVQDLRSLLGVQGDPSFIHIQRWPHAIPQYEIGYGHFIEAVNRFEQAHPGLFVAGTARDGISVGQCIASGYRRAEEALHYLRSSD